jgi:hypothetical protein
MAKKKRKEDNRDIFDKILDDTAEYAPLAGVVAGGALGAKFGIKKATKLIESKRGLGPMAAFPAFAGSTAAGATAGYVAGNAAYEANRKKRRK